MKNLIFDPFWPALVLTPQNKIFSRMNHLSQWSLSPRTRSFLKHSVCITFWVRWNLNSMKTLDKQTKEQRDKQANGYREYPLYFIGPSLRGSKKSKNFCWLYLLNQWPHLGTSKSIQLKLYTHIQKNLDQLT